MFTSSSADNTNTMNNLKLFDRLFKRLFFASQEQQIPTDFFYSFWSCPFKTVKAHILQDLKIFIIFQE